MLLYESMTHRRFRTVHAVVPASAAFVYLGLGLLSACGASMLAAYNPAWLFLALFAGRIFANTFATEAASTAAKIRWKGLAVSVPLLLIASWEAWPRFHAMWTRDEMRDEYAVVTHVGQAYMGKRVATTFCPIERVANVLVEFPMARVGTTDSWLGYDAVIVDRTTQPDAAARGPSVEDRGRYIIIEHGE